MSYDLVIRGGRVVDGSGLAGFTADVAIQGDRIVEIGRVASKGDREIDADGLLVTPGFIDGHTHMDAQLNWDPLGTPSSWQGVTSVMMGNCGFTLAPVRRGEEALVVRNLERAEDIPAEAMAQGIKWEWESFTEYLDVVDKLPKGINYTVNIGHSALRTWAMGARAFEQSANEDDLKLMEGEIKRALAAGASGFSTSRGPDHQTSDDKPVASRLADWSEVRRLVDASAAAGGLFELAMEGGGRSADPEIRADFFERMHNLAIDTRAIITFGMLPNGPRDAWQHQLRALQRAADGGGRMIGQSHTRGITILLSFQTNLPFDKLPHWKDLRSKPLTEQKRLLQDPETRAKLVDAVNNAEYGVVLGAEARAPNWETMRVYQSPLPPNPSVAEVARARGVDPIDCMIDLAIESDMQVFFQSWPDAVADEDLLQIMRHPQTVVAFSDAGAHASQIVEGLQTYLLSYWAREKQAFTIEEAVRMSTLAPARAWGFTDRGLLRPGMAADINLIDFEALNPGMPGVAHDLPAGAKRLTMKANGLKKTIVGGQVLFEDCEHTGALPGKLIRRVNSPAH